MVKKVKINVTCVHDLAKLTEFVKITGGIKVNREPLIVLRSDLTDVLLKLHELICLIESYLQPGNRRRKQSVKKGEKNVKEQRK